MSAEVEPKRAEKVALSRLRWKPAPGEDDIMRERLIIARVMNGFSIEQAQERFGENSIDIGLIESGKKHFPRGHQFLYKAAKIYAVSIDFLFGLTSDTEIDAACSEQYALMRGFEDILKQQAQATSTAFMNYAASQVRITRRDYEEIINSVDSIKRSVEVMREKYGLDDIQGSATLLAAVEATEKAIKPIHKALSAQMEIEKLCMDLALGKTGPISFLLDKSNGIYLEP